MADFRLPTKDELRWPGGRDQVVALLTLGPDELARRAGFPLLAGIEEGLGPWQAIGLVLASGRPIELVWYEHANPSAPTQLRADVNDDYAQAREEAIAILGIKPEEIAWVLPHDAHD